MADRGTELEDLRVIINEIDGALCNYLNQVADPFDPPSKWDEYCRDSFKRLCEAYNNWHQNHDEVGKISMEFWKQIEAELYEAKKQLRAQER